jgi:hypothetical protein
MYSFPNKIYHFYYKKGLGFHNSLWGHTPSALKTSHIGPQYFTMELCWEPSLCFYFIYLFIFNGTGVWTQGLTLARQMLLPLDPLLAPGPSLYTHKSLGDIHKDIPSFQMRKLRWKDGNWFVWWCTVGRNTNKSGESLKHLPFFPHYAIFLNCLAHQFYF